MYTDDHYKIGQFLLSIDKKVGELIEERDGLRERVSVLLSENIQLAGELKSALVAQSGLRTALLNCAKLVELYDPEAVSLVHARAILRIAF